MRGDADDVKRDLAGLLSGPQFRTALANVIVDKSDGFVPPLPVTVYQEERLSKLVFPMCELIAYRTLYPEQDIVKHSLVNIGARWTAVAKDERTVTRYVELLVSATIDVCWGKVLPHVQSGPMLITEEDYSPMTPAVQHPYLKSGVVMVTVPIWRS